MCSFGNIFAIYCKLSAKGLGVMTAGKASSGMAEMSVWQSGIKQ